MTEATSNTMQANTQNNKNSCCNTGACSMLSPLMTAQGKAITHIVGLVLLVILVVLTTITLRNTTTMQEVEVMKVGGEENYEIMKKIYNSEAFATQQKQGLQNALNSLEQGANNPQPQPQQQPSPNGEITPEQLEEATQGAYFQGNEDAPIALLEYSDFLCPFCQRHYANETIKQLREQFPDQVKTAFITNTRGNPTSMQISNAAECSAEQNKYSEFVSAMFQAGPSVTAIDTVAQELEIAGEAFDTCVQELRYEDKIRTQMAQASNFFGASGTPANVLINTETGEYILIAGAFPLDRFVSAVQELTAE